MTHRFPAILAAVAPLPVFALGASPANAQPGPAEVSRFAEVLLARNYGADGPGGVMLVARGDTILFRGALGEADVANDVPLRPDAVFRIGSVTKQFAAAGLLRLVDEGRVRLDDPLSRYLPDYPGGDGITLLQLLNHTAGVVDYTRVPGFIENAAQDLTTVQLIDRFRAEPADFAPGERWAYSNSGYVLIGAVIEAVTGMAWHEYLADAFFEPLGMTHTGYGADPLYVTMQVNGYSYDDTGLTAAHPLSMSQPHAAGALLSNVDDLLIWNRALHEGRVLSSESYARMISPVGPAADPSSRYGLGIYRGTLRGTEDLHHGGAIFGFGSSLGYVQGPDISVIILENDDATNLTDHISDMGRLMAAVTLGDPYPAATAVSLDHAELTAVEGVYAFAGEVTRVLRVVDGALTAQRGAGPRMVLTPIAGDQFLYDDGFTRLALERDAAGSVVRARFFRNGDGEGEIGERTSSSPPAASAGLTLPREALDRLLGVYTASGMILTVYLEGDAMRAQLDDQESVSLTATSATEFDVGEEDAVLSFSANDGLASAATIHQGGRSLVFDRRAD